MLMNDQIITSLRHYFKFYYINFKTLYLRSELGQTRERYAKERVLWGGSDSKK